ncbi:MAG TPA: ABC transporter permease [Methylomirabilota bacterium]|jgi:putative ABC transport system permease protein|nr:ABC transporter permease [Methylomirabilota bacterium]
MALPLTYNVRNVLVRWRTTLFTVLGITLVVAVYVLLQSMAAGIEKSSASTGDPRNVMIVRKGSTAESSSQVSREQFRLIPYLPEVARDAQGRPLVSADVLVLIALPRRNVEGEANVLMRGISPVGMELRPQVRLVEGRWFTPGKRELVVSRRLAARFANFNIGDSFKTGGKQLTVTGWIDGGGTAFDSEIWMDADEARSIFDRENYSSVLVRLADTASATTFTNRIETDKRLPLHADLEVYYYAAQTRTAMPFRFLGNFLAISMSIGAVFAAMNTMYASVGARTREIGTLRVLGYRRRAILLSFIIEGALLSLLGGVLGCGVAWVLHKYFGTTGTISFESFSELVFRFRITPWLAIKGMIFSVLVGIIGSLLPAIRASRLPVISALKAV